MKASRAEAHTLLTTDRLNEVLSRNYAVEFRIRCEWCAEIHDMKRMCRCGNAMCVACGLTTTAIAASDADGLWCGPCAGEEVE